MLGRRGFLLVNKTGRRKKRAEQAGISRAEAVIITVPDFDAIKEALQSINRLKKKSRINPAVIVRVEHEIEAFEARRLGASDVVPSAQTIAHAIVEKVKYLKTS